MQVLREYYVAHPTAAKSEGEIEAIVDKRREVIPQSPPIASHVQLAARAVWRSLTIRSRASYYYTAARGDRASSGPAAASTVDTTLAVVVDAIAVQDQWQLDALNNVRAV